METPNTKEKGLAVISPPLSQIRAVHLSCQHSAKYHRSAPSPRGLEKWTTRDSHFAPEIPFYLSCLSLVRVGNLAGGTCVEKWGWGSGAIWRGI